MINLHNKNSIGKKLALSACLLAFIGNSLTPAAFSAVNGVYQSGVSTNKQASSNTAPTRDVVLKGEISLAKGNQRIAISLRDSDVKQVLRMFADKAGLNIVFHSSVNGNITLDLVNVTLNDAFTMVMQMAELTYTIDNGTLMVARSSDAKKLSFTKELMAAIPVKYVDANTVAVFLNKNIFTKDHPGLSNTEVAISNPRENEVLIFGTKSDYNVAKKVVEELDKPLKIVSYTVNHTTPKEMANLICDTLLKDKGTQGEDLAKSSNGEIVVGGGVIQCSIDSTDETQGDFESFKVQGLKVAYFPTQGIIKLYGATDQQASEIKKIIADADVKQPQAMLEMSIVELNENGSKTLSNNWTIYSKYFTGTLGGSGLSTASDEKGTVTYPLLFRTPADEVLFENPLQPGTPVGAILRWVGTPIIANNIKWAITNGEARLLATPKILVTSGQESTLDMTQDYVKSIKSQYLDNGGMAAQVQKTYEIGSDDGLKISMTPFISPDGYISLNIKPDYSVQANGINDADGNPVVTLLSRRNLDLKNLRIKDGETLVIGGLIREYEKKSTTKTPILGDIPGIGWLFRSTSNSKEKNELVIMITPHIIKDAEDLVEASETETL